MEKYQAGEGSKFRSRIVRFLSNVFFLEHKKPSMKDPEVGNMFVFQTVQKIDPNLMKVQPKEEGVKIETGTYRGGDASADVMGLKKGDKFISLFIPLPQGMQTGSQSALDIRQAGILPEIFSMGSFIGFLAGGSLVGFEARTSKLRVLINGEIPPNSVSFIAGAIDDIISRSGLENPQAPFHFDQSFRQAYIDTYVKNYRDFLVAQTKGKIITDADLTDVGEQESKNVHQGEIAKIKGTETTKRTTKVHEYTTDYYQRSLDKIEEFKNKVNSFIPEQATRLGLAFEVDMDNHYRGKLGKVDNGAETINELLNEIRSINSNAITRTQVDPRLGVKSVADSDAIGEIVTKINRELTAQALLHHGRFSNYIDLAIKAPTIAPFADPSLVAPGAAITINNHQYGVSTANRLSAGQWELRLTDVDPASRTPNFRFPFNCTLDRNSGNWILSPIDVLHGEMLAFEKTVLKLSDASVGAEVVRSTIAKCNAMAKKGSPDIRYYMPDKGEDKIYREKAMKTQKLWVDNQGNPASATKLVTNKYGEEVIRFVTAKEHKQLGHKYVTGIYQSDVPSGRLVMGYKLFAKIYHDTLREKLLGDSDIKSAFSVFKNAAGEAILPETMFDSIISRARPEFLARFNAANRVYLPPARMFNRGPLSIIPNPEFMGYIPSVLSGVSKYYQEGREGLKDVPAANKFEKAAKTFWFSTMPSWRNGVAAALIIWGAMHLGDMIENAIVGSRTEETLQTTPTRTTGHTSGLQQPSDQSALNAEKLSRDRHAFADMILGGDNQLAISWPPSSNSLGGDLYKGPLKNVSLQGGVSPHEFTVTPNKLLPGDIFTLELTNFTAYYEKEKSKSGDGQRFLDATPGLPNIGVDRNGTLTMGSHQEGDPSHHIGKVDPNAPVTLKVKVDQNGGCTVEAWQNGKNCVGMNQDGSTRGVIALPNSSLQSEFLNNPENFGVWPNLWISN